MNINSTILIKSSIALLMAKSSNVHYTLYMYVMGIPLFWLEERWPRTKKCQRWGSFLGLPQQQYYFVTAFTEYHTENCPFHFLRGKSKLISFHSAFHYNIEILKTTQCAHTARAYLHSRSMKHKRSFTPHHPPPPTRMGCYTYSMTALLPEVCCQ